MVLVIIKALYYRGQPTIRGSKGSSRQIVAPTRNIGERLAFGSEVGTYFRIEALEREPSHQLVMGENVAWRVSCRPNRRHLDRPTIRQVDILASYVHAAALPMFLLVPPVQLSMR